MRRARSGRAPPPPPAPPPPSLGSLGLHRAFPQLSAHSLLLKPSPLITAAPRRRHHCLSQPLRRTLPPPLPLTAAAPHAAATAHAAAAAAQQRFRLTRRTSHPPRHRAAHLAVVARSPSLSRIAPRHPPSLVTHVTRASPARVLQPNEPRSKFWVGIADVLHIMTIRFMNTWEETPWRTLGGRRAR